MQRSFPYAIYLIITYFIKKNKLKIKSSVKIKKLKAYKAFAGHIKTIREYIVLKYMPFGGLEKK